MEKKRIFPNLEVVYIAIALIAGGILVVSVLVNFLWLTPFINKLNENSLNFELVQAQRIAYITGQLVDRIVGTSEDLASTIGAIEEKSGETEVILDRFLRDNPEIRMISILNPNGQEIEKLSVAQFFTSADLRNLFSSGEFIRASSGENYISRVFFSESAEPYIIIAVPIFSLDQQRVTGVLRLELNLRRISELVGTLKIGETGRASVVDSEGNLVADPDTSRVLKRVSLIGLAPVAAAIQGQEFKDLEKGRYLNEKNEEVIGVAAPIEELKWAVIVEQQSSEVLGPGQNLRFFSTLYALGSASVIIVLVWLAVLLSGTSKDLSQKYRQLESQRNELNETAKMLVKRDFALSEAQEKREIVLGGLEERTKELEESRIALMNILEDVEESRKKAQEEESKTLTIIKNFADGLLLFDIKNNLSLINPRTEDFFGVKGEEILGRPISELVINFRFKPLFGLIGEEIKEVSRQELALGKNLILEVSSIPVIREEEKFGTLIILHDITREKDIEKMKTEFVSLAAHQLRTPLSAIKWILRTVLDGDVGKISKSQTEILEKGYRSNERMIELINDLLDVARIEEGRFLYNFTSQSVEEIVAKVIKGLEEAAKEKKIKIIFERPSSPLPKISMDAEKIELVIQNLLDNSVRYNKEGGKVAISVKRGTMNNVEVRIADTGIGIPEAQQNRLFNKFFRADNAVRVSTEGTGLGLFIARNIIEAHGGKIWLKSKENEGSTFWFTLPIK